MGGRAASAMNADGVVPNYRPVRTSEARARGNGRGREIDAGTFRAASGRGAPPTRPRGWIAAVVNEDPWRLVARERACQTIADTLEAGGSLVVTGPAGVGR